jgi:hypothetical protein
MTTALPDVTVVIIDAVEHELSRLALVDTLNQITPGDVMIISDTPERIAGDLDVQEIEVPAIRNMQEVERVLWYLVPKHLGTHFALIIQYDGWVTDGAMWRDDWQRFDYIGAKWPWHRGLRVGNGGFSLRSTRLMNYIARHQESIPVQTPEDDTLCRRYRMDLEIRCGFEWAPERTAEQFSFERGPRPSQPTFGFHGIFNWPKMLCYGDLIARMDLATDYLRSKPEWRELPEAN